MKSLWASITQIVSNEISNRAGGAGGGSDGGDDGGELTDAELSITPELKEYVKGICDHPLTFANFPLKEFESRMSTYEMLFEVCLSIESHLV